MDPFSFAILILNALVALPKIYSYVERFAAGCTLWFIQNSKTANLQAISDAAALSARAVTDDDRYNAAQVWVDALKRSRVSP